MIRTCAVASVVLWAACGSASPRPSATAHPATATPGILHAPDGHTFAVVQLVDSIEECSNMGGEHDTFWIDPPPGPRAVAPPFTMPDGTRRGLVPAGVSLAHAGGHGMHLCTSLAQPLGCTSSALGTATYFVAELAPSTRAPAGHDAGWCLDRLPPYAASVVALIPARDRDEARATLAALARGQVKLGVDVRRASVGQPIQLGLHSPH